MLEHFIQGAGGLVTRLLFNGACLSMHSRIRESRVSNCSSGSSEYGERREILKKRLLFEVFHIPFVFKPRLKAGQTDIDTSVDGVVITYYP